MHVLQLFHVLSLFLLTRSDGAISRLFARQACSATAGPTISLSASSSAVQVQNTGSVSATTTLSTSAVCNGAISCSVAKVDQGADFTVSLTGGVLTATFPSTITPKSYEALISCDEAVANVTTPLKNTATWTIYPYKSNGLTLVNGGNTITCTDSAPCLITSDVLNVTSPSNVPASLICYSTTKVQGSFKAVPVPPITELNCLFTQDDIDKGNVFYIAQKILYPGSPVSEEILFSVWDSLDSSNVLTTARLPVTVSWKYQPLLTDKAINLTATVNAPSTLAYTLFSYSEVHGLSGWDIEWRINAPNNIGRFEYYCPDLTCGSVGWNALSGTLPFKFGWIMMNAVRWNPQGQAVVPTSFTMTGKIPGDTSSTLLVTISASTTTGTGSLLPVPTYDFSCSGLTVGSNGSATPSLEFEGFIKNSPIRPLCAKRTVVANEFTAFGDLKLKVPAKLDVVVSGWIAFDAGFKFPTGFKRIMFTGLTTDSGVPGSALSISYNSKTSYAMDLLSPPLQVDTSSLISSASQVAVLFYNDSSTELNYVGITTWTEFWTVSMTIPGPGVYIFGRLDSTNTELPAAFGTSVSYWADWKSKAFTYPNDVKVTLTSDKDGAVKLSKPAFILSSSNMDFAAVYEISTTLPASSIKLEIGLIYKNLDWVVFKSGAGSSGTWEVVTAGVSNSEVNGKTLYTVQVTNAGMWGLAQRTKNSAAETSSALFFVMLTIIILFS